MNPILDLPAEQDAKMTPLKWAGALVIWITTHPSAEPITKFSKRLTGINHLHI